MLLNLLVPFSFIACTFLKINVILVLLLSCLICLFAIYIQLRKRGEYMIINLFFTFLKIGMFSIGGGYAIIPIIQEQVVFKQGWITQKVFTDIITISQMTPGPLAVNTSTFVGMQVAGIEGAISATVGCIISGIIISMFLYGFLKNIRVRNLFLKF